MNIVKFTEKFHKMEVENGFFNLKDSNGLRYWDLVRYHLFMTIYKSLSEVKLIGERKRIPHQKAVEAFRIVFNYIKFLFRINFKTSKYLFYISSKHRDSNGLNVDLISKDILSEIEDEAMVMETFRRADAKYYYKSYFESGKNLFLFFRNIIDKNVSKETYSCSEILKSEFKVNQDFDSVIANYIWNYKNEKRYYKNLFKRIKPRHIFMVQNGIQKGLFTAANELHIPMIELQHGLIGPYHPAYSYPMEIHELETLPKYFFSFSPFWGKNLNYPVNEILSIGNTQYAQKSDKQMLKFDITVIFGEAVALDLIAFIDSLLSNNFSGQICIKLHPNQIEKGIELKERYSYSRNVDVILNERTVTELLAVSGAILAVQSTCVYEALHNKVKVVLLKVKGYQAHTDIFENPNVYLIDSPSELSEILNENHVNNVVEVYFENFDREKLLKFIQDTQN